jgi:imidazolonepropionase
MKADTLIAGISQLVTARGGEAKHGRSMRELAVTKSAALALASGKIVWAGPKEEWTGQAQSIVDVGGKAVVPGLIDPHTHAMWAGDRLADFEARSAGTPYEAILVSGGGIRGTIRATAAASFERLVELTLPRLQQLIESGATTVEVKSGYGFSVEAELKMLEAIRAVSLASPARILSTLLIHVPPIAPRDRPAYLHEVCAGLVPLVSQRKLAHAVDIFIEKESWSVPEAESVLRVARQNSLAVKLHADQFHAIGGVQLAVRVGALSVDHLEASGPTEIAAIAGSSTIATMLPGVSLHLGLPAAPGRKLIDAGAAVAVATDLNPGSSPLFSTAAALALSVRLNGLTAQEAMVAGTVNAACALGLKHTGRLEPGCDADFLVLASDDWRDLIYTLGHNMVQQVWIGGRALNRQ